MMKSRPWGSASKLLSRLPNVSNWDFVSTVSFEDRCLASHSLSNSYKFSSQLFLRIDDVASRFSEEIDRKTDINCKKLGQHGVKESDFFRMRLLAPIGELFYAYKEFLSKSSGNILIDMSSMPKRMLFPILRMTLEAQNIHNVVVTYSIAERYTDEQLAEDPEPITTFPGMYMGDEGSSSDPQLLVIGLGYLQFDLAELKQQLGGNVPVKVLFPFPPGAPAYQRNWRLLLSLFEDEQEIPLPIRIDARDASYAFDVIQDITQSGSSNTYLLPFGPKPFSLAMALHSIKTGSVMMYTQPKVYNPNYSVGIRKSRGEPEIYGYCVKLNSKELY